jgi:phosphinothricin acetyltransferase
MEVILRRAEFQDLEELTNIFNQAILTRTSTGFTETFTTAERLVWFDEHNERYPIIVTEVNEKTVGYITISPYRTGRSAFDRTVEVSYFVDEDYQGQGLGSKLLEGMLEVVKKLKYKAVIAILFHTNRPSIRLLQKYGFQRWGICPNVGEIDGKVFTHLYYGKNL